ncbi:MAG: C-GCAxxG-C-C family protein [Saprospiraceae bacterium]|nr:C-GCAxxG-C-C family protein [Saprospiraceae bacterium]
MTQREEKAIISFRSGFNCAQSVLSAYSDYLNLDENIAKNITSGFGAGMGRLQETCGAVTASFMIISLFNGEKYSNNQESKDAAVPMIQEFTRKFKFKNGAIDCRSLINCDLKTEEGQQFLKDNNLLEDVCEKCILDSIGILEEIIGK